MQSCAALQLKSAGPVGCFVRLSSCFLLISQTVPSSTLQLLITFVPLCAIRLTPCTQSTGCHAGLQNFASHGYLSERYENHGIPDCPDNHEKKPALCSNTVPSSTTFSREGLWVQSKNKMTNEICMCRGEAMREENRTHGYPCVFIVFLCIDCTEKKQC